MADSNTVNVTQLHAINVWVGDVFDKTLQLNSLLQAAGLTQNDVAQLTIYHLPAFLPAMVNLIVDTLEQHYSKPRGELMLRYYGLRDGTPEDYKVIGDSVGVCRERIVQLVGTSLKTFQPPQIQARFKQDLLGIARTILSNKIQ